MSLKEYKIKRNFRSTPEPQGSVRRKAPGTLAYVIQKHQASHLHYDLRLEEGGVLKSWALPKEPPAKEGIKRLAVQTEDHPFEYKDFEGTIPEEEYGAGTVKIWDKGHYLPRENTPAKMVIEISGKKLKGTFCLIKLKSRDGDGKNWLFFKIKDKNN
jgi:DNA ligase D-like protein (predicted 3'-phosphoesterase)